MNYLIVFVLFLTLDKLGVLGWLCDLLAPVLARVWIRLQPYWAWLDQRLNLSHGFIQLFIAFDQLLNVLSNPFSRETWADETLSSRTGRLHHRYPYKIWRVVIDYLFKWQGPDHCVKAFKKELTRYHFPPSMRNKE